MLVLGVETSCDDTAAAVLADGRKIIANVVSSQDAVHSPYGGVVPELASRQHVRNILPIIDAALTQAGITVGDLDGVAVTRAPVACISASSNGRGSICASSCPLLTI